MRYAFFMVNAKVFLRQKLLQAGMQLFIHGDSSTSFIDQRSVSPPLLPPTIFSTKGEGANRFIDAIHSQALR